jgi:hypothetical protein
MGRWVSSQLLWRSIIQCAHSGCRHSSIFSRSTAAVHAMSLQITPCNASVVTFVLCICLRQLLLSVQAGACAVLCSV